MYPDTRLLLDVSRMVWRRWRGQHPTGVDRACLAYAQHYRSRALAVVQRGGFTRVLDRERSMRLFDALIEHQADFARRVMPPLLQAFASRAPAGGYHGAIYLNVGHTGLDLPGHARWVRSSGARAVYYIHDLIPITHPQYCRAGEGERHASRIHAALKLARGITTNSADSAVALAEFASAEHLPLPPVLVAPLGLSVRPLRSSEPPIAQPYFLMIGTIEGRKNYALVLEALRLLVKRMGPAAPKLVLIGARGWAAEDVFAVLDNDARLRPFIIERGQCGDDELLAWLTHARALLFPSFVEGQGLPVAEALALGTPVIASDLPVFRETAGELPAYLSPHDPAAWADLMARYVPLDSPERAARCAHLVGYAPPSWDDHFARLEAWVGG